MPQEVEVALRRREERGALFLLNLCGSERRVVLKAGAPNLLTGAEERELSLPAYGTAVLEVQV